MASSAYTFGELLQKYRKWAGLTQQALAERIGRGSNTIGNWERGLSAPEDRDTVLQVAEALRLDGENKDELLSAAGYATVAGQEKAADPRQPYVVTIQNSHGFAIGDGAQVVQAAPTAAPTPQPAVTVALLTSRLPTAYCYHLTAEAFPFVTVRLDNSLPGCSATVVQATAQIEFMSDTVTATVNLAAGQGAEAALLPLLTAAARQSLTEIRPATLRVTATQIPADGMPQRLLYDETRRIYLHARDTALLATRRPDGEIVDLTRYLAAWVTPRTEQMEALLRQAARRHPQGRFVGYQGADTLTDRRQVVRAQARAIFEALKHDAQVAYINSPLNLGAEAGQIMQRVRLPGQVVQTPGSANCIDGTVLFASLLELAAIDPILVLVPGHAFVGWRIWRGTDQYDFLETTLIGSSDFRTARRSGQQTYAAAQQRGDFARPLFDPQGFARLIDVAACRREGIYPLA